MNEMYMYIYIYVLLYLYCNSSYVAKYFNILVTRLFLCIVFVFPVLIRVEYIHTDEPERSP